MLDMLPILASVVVISLSGVMMPGPMFAMTVAKSYRTPWAGAQVSLGHAVIELPLILLIYFGFAGFFQNNTVQVVLSLLGGAMIIWLGDLVWLSIVSQSIYRTQKLWGQKVQEGIFIVCSLLLVGFGGWFLASG